MPADLWSRGRRDVPARRRIELRARPRRRRPPSAAWEWSLVAWRHDDRGPSGHALRRRRHDARPQEEPRRQRLLVPQPPSRREDQPVPRGARAWRPRPQAVPSHDPAGCPRLRRRRGRRLGRRRAPGRPPGRSLHQDPHGRRRSPSGRSSACGCAPASAGAASRSTSSTVLSTSPARMAHPASRRSRSTTADEKVDLTMAFVGTRGLFERAGFRKVADTDSVTAGFPRVVMRLPLSARLALDSGSAEDSSDSRSASFNHKWAGSPTGWSPGRLPAL